MDPIQQTVIKQVAAASRSRITTLVETLHDQGDLHDVLLNRALYEVPRELFIPDQALCAPDLPDASPYPIDRDARPGQWFTAVYGDNTIITQAADGGVRVDDAKGQEWTSSSSAPGVLVTFLELLEVRDGNKVLEIGTGTGWNAALLCHRVGEENVVTVEVDKDVAVQARRNLSGAGFAPTAIVGDGAAGAKAYGPYDRVLATCAVSRIPAEWIEQTRPGGKVIAPFTPGFGYGHQLVLDVVGDGQAVGRFVGPAGYMMLRSQRPDRAVGDAMASFIHHEDAAEHTVTDLDPREIIDAGPGADLAISALAPGIRANLVGDEDGGTCEATLWLVETRPGAQQDGSWAVVEYEPGRTDFTVEQYGDRRLWDEIEVAYLTWLSWARPSRDRFGYAVTDHDQTIWLDHPANAVVARDHDRACLVEP